MKKYIVSFVAMLLMMLAFPQVTLADTLVEPELDVSAFINVQDNAFQSLNDWSYWEAYTYSDYYADTDGLTEVTLQFACTKSLMDQYVAMLQENGFELVYYDPDAYFSDYKWQLKFVGVPRIPGLGTTGDGETYHLEIEGYKNGKYFIDYTTEIEMKDLGLRIDGTSGGVNQYGESAAAGLYRLADGSFQTTDGRLTAAVGTAMVIRDGRTAVAETTCVSNKSNEWLYVTGYHRNEDFFYAVPVNYAMQGDMYTFNDFVKVDSMVVDEHDTANSIINGVFSPGRDPYFLLTFDGERYSPRIHEQNRFECVLVRTMYYQKNDVAVYYVYARMNRTEPAEIEALCAVSLK